MSYQTSPKTQIGDIAPTNFKHIFLNNGSHDSVGGQPTVGHAIDFLKIAKVCNYRNTYRATSLVELKKVDLMNELRV